MNPRLRLTDEAVGLLSKSSEIIQLQPGFSEQELFSALRDADAFVSIYMAPVTAEMMDAAPRLKGVVTFGSGCDHLDLAAATARGIYVSNTRGANAEAVAELAVSMMLNLMRKACRADSLVRAGEWQRGAAFPSWLSGRELAGKTLGILGLGTIGRRVARIARGFDMRVLAYDPFVSSAVAQDVGAELVELPLIFRQSDVVTIHVPLTAETRPLVTVQRLAWMKSTAYLINLSRGPVVDEAALVEALREGRIAGAGLDVFEVEPLPPEHPLLTLDNVVFTPHFAGGTAEAKQRQSMAVARQVLQIVAGEVPDNLVNRAVLEE
jgi:D-3-phosphoglycerate dehydrogenase